MTDNNIQRPHFTKYASSHNLVWKKIDHQQIQIRHEARNRQPRPSRFANGNIMREQSCLICLPARSSYEQLGAGLKQCSCRVTFHIAANCTVFLFRCLGVSTEVQEARSHVFPSPLTVPGQAPGPVSQYTDDVLPWPSGTP